MRGLLRPVDVFKSSVNPDSSVGRVLTLDQAIQYYEAVAAAEKAMGPLTHEEKMVVLAKFGSDLTNDGLVDLLQGKRVLIVKDKNGKES